MALQRPLSKEEALGAWRARCGSVHSRAHTQRARRTLDTLTYIHGELGKVAVMEPIYWQRREGARQRVRGWAETGLCLFLSLCGLRARCSPLRAQQTWRAGAWT